MCRIRSVRSETRSMNSKSWIVSKLESKPPTASASERRTTSRWPMYIAPRA